jgi:hypothetical protein
LPARAIVGDQADLAVPVLARYRTAERVPDLRALRARDLFAGQDDQSQPGEIVRATGLPGVLGEERDRARIAVKDLWAKRPYTRQVLVESRRRKVEGIE